MLDIVEFDRILRKVGFVESISEWLNGTDPLYTFLMEGLEALPACTVIITDAAGNVLTLPEKC